MPTSPVNSSVKILRQLYFLRNITITFILLMVLLAILVLNINLPVLPLGTILFIMALTNLISRFFIAAGKDISDRLLFSQLLLEILSFSLILYFTGGATNPFTFFYLIPLAFAATVIPGKWTWILTALTVIFYSLLLKFYVPLTYPMQGHQHSLSGDGQFSQHVLGMWFGFLVSAMLVTWFITYLSKELKQREQAIAEARQRELRDQQMVTLGTLAAGTAHELGSPLATLAIIAGDITHSFTADKHPELFENQKILRQQINRCKKILSVLSDTIGESRADEGYLIEPQEFFNQTLKHWQALCHGIACTSQFINTQNKARLLYDKTISQAIINLLNNAADATTDVIKVHAKVTDHTMCIDIIDRGSGISNDAIALAGETSFSTKPDGMGIGLFLAITTLRRSGGSVSFQRLQSAGTLTRVKLPLLPSTHD